MATIGFESFIISLERVGFIDVLLPFLLVFTIIFAILEKTKILWEWQRNMNMVIAMHLALRGVITHIKVNLPACYYPVQIINAGLPSVSLVIIAIVSLMILVGVFAHDRLLWGMTAPGWIGFVSIVIIAFIFGSAAGWWQVGFLDWLDSIFGSDVIAVIIMILVFGIIIAFVTGGGEAEKKGGYLERAGLNLGELFSKSK